MDPQIDDNNPIVKPKRIAKPVEVTDWPSILFIWMMVNPKPIKRAMQRPTMLPIKANLFLDKKLLLVGIPIDCATITLKAPIRKHIMVMPIDSPVKSTGGCFGLGEIYKIKSAALETSIIEASVTIKPANQIRRVRNLLETVELFIIEITYFSLRYPSRVSLLYRKHLI